MLRIASICLITTSLYILVARLLIAHDTSQEAEELATHQIQPGDFQSATKILRQALRQSPKDIELWNLLGIAETELKQPESPRALSSAGLRWPGFRFVE